MHPPRRSHDHGDAAQSPERESGINGSVFLNSGRKEFCREHWCSLAHEGRIDEQEVAIDSRTNEWI
jgi:hypothetical protein